MTTTPIDRLRWEELRSEIDRVTALIDTLKLDRLEFERELEILDDPIKYLATELHRKICHYNHTDMCAWGYETNEDFTGSGPRRNSSVRHKYYQKALKISNACDIDTAIEIVNLL